MRRETFVPQVYEWGGEAQVDWYYAEIEVAGERRPVHMFAVRSMASGGAFHVAYYHATQQAFLEAHELFWWSLPPSRHQRKEIIITAVRSRTAMKGQLLRRTWARMIGNAIATTE